MEGKVSVRALGLVAVMVFFCGVAEADNPCYDECFKDCVSPQSCTYDPQCIATCGVTCSVQDTCKHVSRKVLRNSEAVKIQNDAIEKHYAGALEGNPCYAECVQDCLNTCSFIGCAACPAICGTHDTCKHMKTIEINSAKGKEAVAIQSHTIEKKPVGVVRGNPCYAECVQDCLNNCGLSPFGCASCPVMCGMHSTCRDLKSIEIDSGNIAKSHVGVEARNTIGQYSVAYE